MREYRICEIKDCERVVGRHGAKGYCPLHYQRLLRTGDPNYTKHGIVCSVDGCDRTKHTKVGYCTKHYKRYKKGGNLEEPSNQEKRAAIDMGDHCLIPLGVLAKNGYAVVDKVDKHLESHQWSMNAHGYAQTSAKPGTALMHHLIAGKPPKPLVTDHINRNKLDNRRVNLRFVTERENALNKRYAQE